METKDNSTGTGDEKSKNELPKKCPCCGASMKLHWHRLSKGLVQTLIKVRKEVIAKRSYIVHIADLNLTNTEFGNFQKLRFHGLIAKSRDKQGKHDRGYWIFTRKGNLFCKGLVQTPDKVGTFRNIIRKKSSIMVTMQAVLENQDLPIWDNIDDMGMEFIDITDVHEDLWDPLGQGILNL